MAIQSDIDLGLIAVGTSDTALVTTPGGDVERIGITACVAHNTTGGDLTLTLWESPDLTTASGSEIATYTIGSNSSIDILEVIGQGYDGTSVIGQGSGAGINFRATCTTYSEGD